jgi:elongation factor 1-beta
MADVVITMKIMPESPDVDLEVVKVKALEVAKGHGAKGDMQSNIEPLAFGLKQLLILGMYEVGDNKDFDEVAADMAKIEGVQSAEVDKMDLAMG